MILEEAEKLYHSSLKNTKVSNDELLNDDIEDENNDYFVDFLGVKIDNESEKENNDYDDDLNELLSQELLK